LTNIDLQYSFRFEEKLYQADYYKKINTTIYKNWSWLKRTRILLFVIKITENKIIFCLFCRNNHQIIEK